MCCTCHAVPRMEPWILADLHSRVVLCPGYFCSMCIWPLPPRGKIFLQAPPVQTQAARGYIPHAVKPKTKIVLNRGVEGLGKQGDVVEVAPGYYRNFLYPTGQVCCRGGMW